MKGYVYAIHSHQTEQVYVGSTTQALSARMASHRRDAKLDRECTSKKILVFDDAYIELIEVVEFADKAELRAVEGKHIRECNCVNKNIAGRTRKETVAAHYSANRDKILEHKSAYYKANRVEILARLNAKHDCPCGGKYTTAGMAQHKRTLLHKNFENDTE